MANTYLQKSAFGSANQKTYTISFWSKLAVSATGNVLAFVQSGNYVRLFFENGALKIKSVINSSTVFDIKTNRLFRDFSSWYHFVIAMDTTQATEANRIKVYVNGVQETSLATATYPSQNFDTDSNNDLKIGYNGTDNYFDGLLSHFHYIDGTAYDASAFGSTDSVTGQWKINTSPSVTYGSGGFLILKDGNTITDQSSNSNNFTLGGGTLTNTEDCPSNVFATLNPLRPNGISQTYSNGNTTVIRTGTGGQMNGTLGVKSGKWYYECLIDDYWQYLGWTALSLNTSQTITCAEATSGFYGLYSNASAVLTYANGSQTTQGSYTPMASGQIWGIAFDADNAKMYFSLNGTFLNSSNPANQTNPAMSSIPVTDFLVPAIGQGTGSRSSTIKMNFGNGFFGTTAVTTNSGNGYAGTDGKSIFNYQPPTGYSALSTKGLNE